MQRIVFLVLGWLAVALGLIGVVLPVLPTTPLMILAAFFFTKGSPRARAWLVGHAQFGPHIKNWEDQGAIAPRARRLAVAVMAGVFLVSWMLGLAGWILAVQAGCMGPAAIFILTRPAPTT